MLYLLTSAAGGLIGGAFSGVTSTLGGADGSAWKGLFDPLARDWEKLLPTLLGPPSPFTRHPLAMANFGLKALRPASSLANRAAVWRSWWCERTSFASLETPAVELML